MYHSDCQEMGVFIQEGEGGLKGRGKRKRNM